MQEERVGEKAWERGRALHKIVINRAWPSWCKNSAILFLCPPPPLPSQFLPFSTCLLEEGYTHYSTQGMHIYCALGYRVALCAICTGLAAKHVYNTLLMMTGMTLHSISSWLTLHST